MVYLVAFIFAIPAVELLPKLGLLLIWMIGAASFGHYINDWFDIAQDKAAGKGNAAASHSLLIRICISTLLASMSLLPWFWLGPDEWSVIPAILHLSLIHI